MSTPRTVDIELTSRCNARCAYCYYFDNPDVVYDDLPTADWLAFFAELGRLGVMEVVLAGGEPLLRDDLPELLQGVVDNRMRFTLLSNGALLTDELAALLAATGRCNSVQISIDGPRAEVHDEARGVGSFEAAVAAIRLLGRHGVPVTSRLTIHNDNVEEIPETVGFLLDELGLPGMSTNAVGFLGSCKASGGAPLLDDDGRARAMELLLEACERYPDRIEALDGPQVWARQWVEFEALAAAGAPPLPSGGALTACGCAWNKLAVRADGAIVVCSLLPHLVLGRINVDDLREVWLHHPILQAHRRRESIALETFEQCAGCDFVSYCTGNCPAVGYAMTGLVDHPNPDSCLRLYRARGGRLPGDAAEVEGG